MSKNSFKKHKNRPAISVVVAVKNGASSLQRCIGSFSDQSLLEKELLVFDGDSQDGTVQIIQKNQEKIYYWESRPDRGIAHAWNKALNFSNGRWVIFLGADDWFVDREVLRSALEKIEKHHDKKTRIVYGKLNLISSNGRLVDTLGTEWEKCRPPFFSEKMTIPNPACFYHHSVFDEYGRFDESFKIVMDYEFLLRALEDEEAKFIDETITNMSLSGVSSNAMSLYKMHQEVDKAFAKHRISSQGFRRSINSSIYRALPLIERYGGIRCVNLLLDVLRIVSMKKPFWLRS